MSFKEFETAVKGLKESENNYFPRKPLASNLVASVKYMVVDIRDEISRAVLEQIMTRSLVCEGMLKEAGDIIVLYENPYMCATGELLTAIKYIEVTGTK